MKKIAILSFALLTSSFVFSQKTYVPDDKFEQALIDLGYDTTLDDSVLTANISSVTTLDVNNKEISDLKKNSISGIQKISENIASDVIETISGDKLNESSIKAAVEDISKKNLNKYL